MTSFYHKTDNRSKTEAGFYSVFPLRKVRWESIIYSDFLYRKRIYSLLFAPIVPRAGADFFTRRKQAATIRRIAAADRSETKIVYAAVLNSYRKDSFNMKQKILAAVLAVSVLVTELPLSLHAEEVKDASDGITSEMETEMEEAADISAVPEPETTEEAPTDPSSEETDKTVTTSGFAKIEEPVISLPERLPLEEAVQHLPDTLEIYLKETEEWTEIPVKWECLDDYNREDQASFVFEASPEEVGIVLSADELPRMEIYYENVSTYVTGASGLVAISQTLSDESLILEGLDENEEELTLSSAVRGASATEEEKEFWESLDNDDCYQLTAAQREVFQDFDAMLDPYLFSGKPASSLKAGGNTYYCTARIAFDNKVFNNDSALFQAGTDPNNIQTLTCTYFASHPQYFFLTTSFLTTSSSIYINFLPDFVEKQDRADAADAIHDIITEIEGRCGGTDYEILRQFHDMECSLVTYDHDAWSQSAAGRKAPQSDWISGNIMYAQSMASTFLNGHKTVCAGYSQGYTALCNAAGIPAFSVTSKDHQWNKVFTAGKWFNADLTADDSGDPETASYQYFLKSDATVKALSLKNHTWNDVWDTYLATEPTELSGYDASTITFLLNEPKAVMNGISAETQIYAYPVRLGIQSLAESYAPVTDTRDFQGWYRDEELTTPITEVSSSESGAVFAYAKWSPKAYSIEYDPNDGTLADGTPTGYLLTESSFTIPDPSMSGRNFLAWYLDEGLTERLTDTSYAYHNQNQTVVSIPDMMKSGSEGDMMLYAGWYAEWVTKGLTVNYDANGGVIKSGIARSVDVDPFASFTALSASEVIRPGYTLSGWSTVDPATNKSKTFRPGKSYVNDTPSGTEWTLMAEWKPKAYKIKFVLNGGKNSGANKTSFKPEPEAQRISFIGAPVRAGYELARFTVEPVSLSEAFTVEISDGVLTGYSVDQDKLMELMDNAGTAEVKVTAVWRAEKEKVTLDPNGGSWRTGERYTDASGQKTVTEGSDPLTVSYQHDIAYITPLPVYPSSSEYYSFLGWTTTPGSSAKYKPSAQGTVTVKNLPSGTTLYAVWGNSSVWSYAVTFSPGENGKWFGGICRDAKEAKSITKDATDEVSVVYESGTTYTAPVPVRVGYAFEGWALPDGKVKYKPSKTGEVALKNLVAKKEGAANPVELTAVWKKSAYKLVYQLNGGKNAKDAPAKFAYADEAADAKTLTIPVPERKYYAFNDWYLDAEMTLPLQGYVSGITKNENGSYSIALDKEAVFNSAALLGKTSLTLYAKWVPLSYRVTYDLDRSSSMGKGASWPDGTTEEAVRSYAFDQTYDLATDPDVPVPVNPGFSFQGWAVKPGGSGKLYKYSEKKGVASLPVKNAVNPVGNETTDAITFYPKWTVFTYKVNYQLNGGSKGSGTAASFKQPVNASASKTFRVMDAKKKGAIFQGWYLDKGFKQSFADYLTEKGVPSSAIYGGMEIDIEKLLSAGDLEKDRSLTLYAKWDPYLYHVTYDANGGFFPSDLSTKATLSYEYGKSYLPVSPSPIRLGGEDISYEFLGWGTTADAKSPKYKPNAKLYNLKNENGARETLYAVWKELGIKDSSYGKTYGTASARAEDGKILLSWDLRAFPSGTAVYPAAVNRNTGNVEYLLDADSQDSVVTPFPVGTTGKREVTLPLAASVTPDGLNDHSFELAYAVSGSTPEAQPISVRLQNMSLCAAIRLSDGTFYPVTNAAYVKYPENLSSVNYFEPGNTKKGIQIDNAYDLAVALDPNNHFDHAFVNFVVGTFYGKGPAVFSSDAEAVSAGYNFRHNGKYYYFNGDAVGIEYMEKLTQAGISVTAQILLDDSPMSMNLVNRKCRVSGKTYYSWENTEQSSRETIEALATWLSQACSRRNAYVSNWILGNEVNSYKVWQYSEGMTEEEFYRSYAETMHIFSSGLRSTNSGARLYVCTDDNWNKAPAGYSSREFLDTFNRMIDGMDATMNWGIAFHPYAVPLNVPSADLFWKNSGISHSDSSAYVNMSNLDVLVNHSKAYTMDGSVPDIILSELGYTPGPFGSLTDQNLFMQAAALIYSYAIASADPDIDGFMIRSLSNTEENPFLGIAADVSNPNQVSWLPAGMLYRSCNTSSGAASAISSLDQEIYSSIWKTRKGSYTTFSEVLKGDGIDPAVLYTRNSD